MKKLLAILFLFSATVIVVFLLFTKVEEAINDTLSQQQKIVSYSLLSFIFLVADIVLPIPSSLVMILNGKMLGLAGGFFLSLVASVLSSSIGFYIGRKTASGLNRFFSQQEIKQANQLFERFGDLSIAVSKGIPVLSETVSYLSGNTSITFKQFLLYSVLGHLPVSLIYALVGNYASSLDSYVISGGVMVATISVFFVLRILVRKRIETTRNGIG